MDTNKWKSVLLPREIYDEVKVLAEANHRTLSGQLKFMHQWHKKNNPKKLISSNSPIIAKRNSMMVKLIEEDHMSMVSVGQIFGISKQRVQQIYKKFSTARDNKLNAI
tara:strand:- start:244 stop:567 length:324 start_codon:yes stop_codon:yes gene_type:complete